MLLRHTATLLLLGLMGSSAFLTPLPGSSNNRREKLPALQVFGTLFAPTTSTSTAASAAKAKEIKDTILQLSKGKDNGTKASKEEKEQVLALAKDLNKLNKVKAIARSTETDGLWRLVFTTTTGSSSGKLGPFVGEVLQDIDSSSKEYVNIVKILGGAVEGSLVAKWEVLSANEWKVIFDTITFKVLGIPIVDKKPLGGQAGVWRMTYADEDLRVLYAAGMTNQGKPARTENIYILKKA